MIVSGCGFLYTPIFVRFRSSGSGTSSPPQDFFCNLFFLDHIAYTAISPFVAVLLRRSVSKMASKLTLDRAEVTKSFCA